MHPLKKRAQPEPRPQWSFLTTAPLPRKTGLAARWRMSRRKSAAGRSADPAWRHMRVEHAHMRYHGAHDTGSDDDPGAPNSYRISCASRRIKRTGILMGTVAFLLAIVFPPAALEHDATSDGIWFATVCCVDKPDTKRI